MATAEEILLAAGEAENGALEVLTIDNDLRTITVPESVRNLGVEGDDDVKRLRFAMPRRYGEFDLSIFAVHIVYVNASNEPDLYIVTDAESSTNEIRFSWLIGENALKYKGTAKFAVHLRRVENGRVTQRFNTEPAAVQVLDGLDADLTEEEQEKARDILTQLLAMLDAKAEELVQVIKKAGDARTAEVNTAGAAQVAAIENKGSNTLAAIPEDYTAMDTDVKSLKDTIDDCANLEKSNLYNKNDLVAGYLQYDGTIIDSVNFSHTPKIYIKGNDTITYKGLTVLGTDPRHIWYGENGDWLKSFLPQKDGEYTVTVPHDASYVAFSVRKDDFDTFECLAYHPLVKTVNDMASREIFEIDGSSLSAGYIYEQYGAEVVKAVDGYSHTAILPVKSGATLVLDTITPIAYQYMLLYDSSNNLIGAIPSLYTDRVRRREAFNIPTNCAGIRFNVSNTQIDNLGGYYDCVREFTAVTRHKPIISFVDDDTSSVALVERYYNACVLAGVKGNFAVQTMELTNQSGLAELLLSYEEKGFGMLYHCHSQIPAYNVGSTRDIVAAEQNFVRGLREMRTHGFCNYNYWITPYGVHDNAIRQMAIRRGMKCLASAANWGFNLPTNGDRYFIKRADIPSNDSGAHTLDDLKALIDAAATNNAWIICTTHFNTWADDADDTRIKQIADYATSKGFECMTFAEAFDIYEGAYRAYEML